MIYAQLRTLSTEKNSMGNNYERACPEKESGFKDAMNELEVKVPLK